MEKLIFPLLKANQIEVKVKKTTESGAVLLLYKTARIDMDLLDSTVGPDNWTNDYREIKGNLYCGIAIRRDGEWIWKWDCGIESRTDSDGNEKKGEASDAFKRAGFRWGIGRELYTAPFTFATMPTERQGAGYRLAGFPKFWVDEIGYEDGCISRLRILCKNRNAVTEVFSMGCGGKGNSTRSSGGAAPAAAAPAEPTPEEDKPATKAQIEVLMQRMNEVQRAATCRKYGENLEHLTAAVAGRLLQRLRAQEA